MSRRRRRSRRQRQTPAQSAQTFERTRRRRIGRLRSKVKEFRLLTRTPDAPIPGREWMSDPNFPTQEELMRELYNNAPNWRALLRRDEQRQERERRRAGLLPDTDPWAFDTRLVWSQEGPRTPRRAWRSQPNAIPPTQESTRQDARDRSMRALLGAQALRDSPKDCVERKKDRRAAVLRGGHGGINGVKRYKPRKDC